MPNTATYDSLLDALGDRVVRATHWHTMARCPLPGHSNDDRNAGLSISRSDNDLPLVYCHGQHGACYGELMESLGFDAGGEREVLEGKYELAAHYPYTDEADNLLFAVRRYQSTDGSGKTFRQAQPDGDGGWLTNLDGVRRVPYHLPAMMVAINEKKPILLVEGEKDVHTAETYGFVATTVSQGASAWGVANYPEFFKGAEVVVIPDLDAVGIQHARTMAKDLTSVASEVRLVMLPDTVGPKGDLTDFLNMYDQKELVSLIQETPAFNPALDRIDEAYTESGAIARGCDINATDDSVEFYWSEDDLRMTFESFLYSASKVEAMMTVSISTTGTIIRGRRVSLTSNTYRKDVVTDLNRVAKGKGTYGAWNTYVEHAFGTTDAFVSSPAAWETFDMLDDTDALHRSWMVEPIFAGGLHEEGATLLIADGGTGKSYIALAVALAIGAGHSTIGDMQPRTQGKVLFLDWESNKVKHNQRLMRIAKGAHISYEDAVKNIFYSRQRGPLVNMIGSLRKQIREQGITCVVIDSMRGAAKGSLVNDDTSEMFFNAVNSLGIPAFIIHHVNRSEGTYYGSAFIRNFARYAWEVMGSSYMSKNSDQHTGKKVLHLRCVKDNDGDMEGEDLGITIEWGEFDISLASIGGKLAEMYARGGEDAGPSVPTLIYELLQAENRWMSIEAIASSVGQSDNVKNVRDNLSRMARAMKIKKRGERGEAEYASLKTVDAT